MHSLSKLFRRVAPVSLSAGSAAEHEPVSGLVVIVVDLEAKASLEGQFGLFLPGQSQPVHSRALALAAGDTRTSLILHSQLLSPGLQDVTVRFTPAVGQAVDKTLHTIRLYASSGCIRRSCGCWT